ncbi:MAG: hypothetical protein IT437_10710 [Phycisphaerales bacterium]|nr:hypothetical protein [Phycisphaerales bacterium]
MLDFKAAMVVDSLPIALNSGHVALLGLAIGTGVCTWWWSCYLTEYLSARAGLLAMTLRGLTAIALTITAMVLAHG